jgi:signal transduction histidine kinase
MFRLNDSRHRQSGRLGGWRRAARREEMALACHELRGSLTAARLGLAAQRGATVSSARMRAVELELEKAALALDDLGGAQERVRGPELSLSARWLDLWALLVDIVEAWRGVAERKGVELRLRDPGAPVPVRGDRLRLAQAIGNLIANAIEHGAGPVEVRARAEDATVRIEVIDGGTGLPVPVDELVRRRRRGVGRRGRGLAITARIAAAHGGRLSGGPSDRGARLVLELPSQAAGARPERLRPGPRF